MSLNIQLLRDSFEAVKPVAVPVVDFFYKHLFSSHPEAKSLFEKVDLKVQKNHLINSLVYIVDHVDKSNELVPYLQKMGVRHVGYGAKAEHYQWVGSSLIATFKHFFKHQWSKELESTWIEAYSIISEQMLLGAESTKPKVTKSEPHVSSASASFLNSSAKDPQLKETVRNLIDVELKAEISNMIEKTVKEMLEAEIRKQSEKLIQSLRSAA